MDNLSLQGQKQSWSLIEKLGEGDAGEVFLVEGILDQRPAILKRPRRSVFNHEVRRQAEQIRSEGRTLAALSERLASLPGIHTPALIDQSRSGTEFSERYFIIIERAASFDLAWLARISRLGLENGVLGGLSAEEQVFITAIARQAQIPARILLSTLSAQLAVFDVIHSCALPEIDSQIQGLIWNDVKAEHLFWNPNRAAVTIIDWGNSRFLETDGASRDRRNTAGDDLRQFVEEMGRFLNQAAPALAVRLGWPTEDTPLAELTTTTRALQEQIAAALREEQLHLNQARAHESELLVPAARPEEAIDALELIHERIIALGEIPDYGGALRLASGAVSNLAAAGDLEGVRALCIWASGLPGASRSQWSLLSSLAGATAGQQLQSEARGRLAEAVRGAANGDWEATLWALITYLGVAPEPEWWNDLLAPIRRQAGGESAAAIRPLLTLRRTTLTLQAASQQLEDRLVRASSTAGPEETTRLERIKHLIDRMREVIRSWVQVDPLPPYSGLNYTDLDLLIDDIDREMPGAGAELTRALKPARELCSSALSAWNRREFSNAGRLLRSLLVWDPDRRRLIGADQAIQAAADWLTQLRSGPPASTHLQTYVSDLEYDGRELRNRLGPASWLDAILEALKAVRNGAWPGGLITAQPALLAEMPWMQRYERAEIVQKALQPHLQPTPLPTITGQNAARFGPEDEIRLIEPLDGWIPEARGSSARVYLSHYRTAGSDLCEGALKLLRTDKPDYGLPLFREEVLVLQAMQGVPGVNPLLESGFLWMDGDPLPPDHNLEAIKALRGEAIRFGLDASAEFLAQLDARTREGWTPYLMLEKQRREDNLLLLCDASLNRGTFQPVSDLLRMAIQICDILEQAHQRNVVYRDHKILHYYWRPAVNGVFLIDWNVARYHPEGVSEIEIHMDMVQLGARGLHHILTGRTAPGALPLGPTRPEEIEQSAQIYRAQWTYDDQRLGENVRVILEQLLAGSYTHAADLREDLKRAYMQLV